MAQNSKNLRFLVQHPCLICGRSPNHAHHIRFDNQGALTLKSVTNSRYRFAPFTSAEPRDRLSGCGGRSTKLTRSWWPHACGKKASSRWRRAAISECRFQTLAQLLAVAVIAGFCESAAANQISLLPEVWEIRFSYDMPNRPYAHGPGWAFDFPIGSNCSAKNGCPGVHYITTKYITPIPAHAVLILSFEIEADSSSVFNFKLEKDNACDGAPASVRAILQRADDDLYGASNRFWSNPASVVLAPGEHTMTVELSLDQWTNVEGERSESGFAEILKNMGNIGVTFGGGCFFGHGVNVSGGGARFIMTRFELKQ